MGKKVKAKRKSAARRKVRKTARRADRRSHRTARETTPRIPPEMKAAIEAQRRQLLKAQALVGCLVITLDHHSDSGRFEAHQFDNECCADVAALIYDLIGDAADHLDSVHLAGP